jgi:hypothetical protein
MTFYIRSLQRSFEADAAPIPQSKPDLRQRFVDWFDNLPDISRIRPYSMREFETALSTQGRFLAPVLAKLGWERHRKWSSTGPSPRFWLPPHK